jgi:hypothetical protein
MITVDDLIDAYIESIIQQIESDVEVEKLPF